MKNNTATAMPLAHDVARYWNQCLAVNSSWRDFTHSLTVLNTFDCLHIEDVEFVAELLLHTELFETEDFMELAFACFEFASERFIDAADITSTDLAALAESGLSPDEVIGLAVENGVNIEVINEFAGE